MGPPIFIGGNFTNRFEAGVVVSRFNGAADFHRRKSPSRSGIRKAPALLQWGRRFSSAEMILSPLYISLTVDCFNGAADFHRRKSQI